MLFADAMLLKTDCPAADNIAHVTSNIGGSSRRKQWRWNVKKIFDEVLEPIS